MKASAIKAERLLRKTLPKREWLRYSIRGSVFVRGSEGGLFKLTKKKAYNIEQLKPIKRTMCTVPADVSQLEHADIMVAQYLSLINDEKAFVKTANIKHDGFYAGASRQLNHTQDALRYGLQSRNELRGEWIGEQVQQDFIELQTINGRVERIPNSTRIVGVSPALRDTLISMMNSLPPNTASYLNEHLHRIAEREHIVGIDMDMQHHTNSYIVRLELSNNRRQHLQISY